jgi:uncharacterized protein (DUF488 family)
MDSATAGGEPAPVPIHTIGYGSRTLDEFLHALGVYEIAFLIDIRSVPYSKYKPEFSRAKLEEALAGHGIRYLYLGDQLGGQPADRSCYVDGQVVYDLIRQKPFFQEGLSRLRNAYAKRLRVALMCSEGKPEICHRSKLIGEALVASGIAVAHIDENDELRNQGEIIAELTGGQLNLFDEGPSFKSRKRYRPKGAETAATEEPMEEADERDE